MIEGEVRLLLDEAAAALPAILGQATALGASVKSVRVVEPDLEAVFLHLTGSALAGVVVLRIIGSICAKDVRQRLRDRSILVIGFVAPIAIAALMNFAFGGVVGFNFTAAIVDEDGGPVAASVLEIFDDPDLAEVVTVERYDTSDAARQAVIDGDVDAALVIPAGFSDSAQDLGASVDLVVFTSVDADIAGEVLTSIASSITSRFNTGRVVAIGSPGERGRPGHGHRARRRSGRSRTGRDRGLGADRRRAHRAGQLLRPGDGNPVRAVLDRVQCPQLLERARGGHPRSHRRRAGAERGRAGRQVAGHVPVQPHQPARPDNRLGASSSGPRGATRSAWSCCASPCRCRWWPSP